LLNFLHYFNYYYENDFFCFEEQDECQRETQPSHTRRSIAFTINATATPPGESEKNKAFFRLEN